MNAPIELWYWPTPNGWKVSIAFEEMGTPYVVKPVDIGRGEQFSEEFQTLSPNNRIPAIVDPDGPDGRPLSIFESGAILQYLGTKSGLFYPDDPRTRVEVDQWLIWQMAGEDVADAWRVWQTEGRRMGGVLDWRDDARFVRMAFPTTTHLGEPAQGPVAAAAGAGSQSLPAAHDGLRLSQDQKDNV